MKKHCANVLSPFLLAPAQHAQARNEQLVEAIPARPHSAKNAVMTLANCAEDFANRRAIVQVRERGEGGGGGGGRKEREERRERERERERERRGRRS